MRKNKKSRECRRGWEYKELLNETRSTGGCLGLSLVAPFCQGPCCREAPTPGYASGVLDLLGAGAARKSFPIVHCSLLFL
jgi:hypothetical protein